MDTVRALGCKLKSDSACVSNRWSSPITTVVTVLLSHVLMGWLHAAAECNRTEYRACVHAHVHQGLATSVVLNRNVGVLSVGGHGLVVRTARPGTDCTLVTLQVTTSVLKSRRQNSYQLH